MSEAELAQSPRLDPLTPGSSHERDPEAIDFSSPEAAQYAERVEALGRATCLKPLAHLQYGSDRGQRLDIYAPPGAWELPILVFFHGGAWVNGHLGWLRFMAPCITALPAVLVAGTYRLAPRCRWPSQYDDAGAALALVRHEAHRYGGDPNRIAIGGHSAGGHLASLIALRDDGPPLRACLPVSAPFNLQHGDAPLESREGRVYRYLFQRRSQDREASPLEFVQGPCIPFHIVWGEKDLNHVSASSEAMMQALTRTGTAVTHSIVPGASHFDTHLALGDQDNPWYLRLRELLA